MSPRYDAEVVGPEHAVAWDRLLSTHPLARCIVPRWDVVAGWLPTRIGVFVGGALVGGAELVVQRIQRTPLALSRINVLMVPPSPEAPVMLDALMQAVERYCRRHLVLETELRVRVPAVGELAGFGFHDVIRATLERWGYRALSKTDTTYFVDIARDDDELLKSFKSEYRNRIRKARKSGVQVVGSRDHALFDQFYESYVETCRRKGAPVPPPSLVGEAIGPLVDRGHAEIFVEQYDDDIANMVIVDSLGVPCYVLGTRMKNHVTGKVFGAAQVLHFEIMRALRDRGHRYYDLGGCEGPVPIEHHPNYGVWRFKYGFRPVFVRFIPYMRKTRGPFEGALRIAHELRGDPV